MGDKVVDVMDADANGYISKEEFCQGCLSIADNVRPVSIMEICKALCLATTKIERCDEMIQDVLKESRDAALQNSDWKSELLQSLQDLHEKIDKSNEAALHLEREWEHKRCMEDILAPLSGREQEAVATAAACNVEVDLHKQVEKPSCVSNSDGTPCEVGRGILASGNASP